MNENLVLEIVEQIPFSQYDQTAQDDEQITYLSTLPQHSVQEHINNTYNIFIQTITSMSSLKSKYPLVIGQNELALRTVCEPITTITPTVRKLAKAMEQLVHEYDGV